MKVLDEKIVERELTKLIDFVCGTLNIEVSLTVDTCPDEIGITSQVLISVMSRLEDALEVDIPEDCYIFYDKANNKQLTIKEATKKLIKISTNV